MVQRVTEMTPTGGHVLLNGDVLKDTCPYCGKVLNRFSFEYFGKSFIGPLEPCDCPEGRKEADRREADRLLRIEKREKEELEERRRYSGLSKKQIHQNFVTFMVDDSNSSAFHAAVNFARNFKPRYPEQPFFDDKDKGQGVMIVGSAGVGKTHLAAAIANYLIEMGCYATFRTVPELMGELRRSYSNEDEDEYELMRRMKRTVLLVLDDLGKEQQTEWSLAKLYEIVNSRYENYMPMVVTSNYSVTELYDRLSEGGDKNTAMAIISRIVGMCKCVSISGQDRRLTT